MGSSTEPEGGNELPLARGRVYRIAGESRNHDPKHWSSWSLRHPHPQCRLRSLRSRDSASNDGIIVFAKGCQVLATRVWALGEVERCRDRGVLTYRIDGLQRRYRFPAVLVIGSEKRGLSDEVLELADFVVRIPMRGGCDSLNAAVATGVLLFEMSSRR
jgi:hypothetical protein